MAVVVVIARALRRGLTGFFGAGGGLNSKISDLSDRGCWFFVGVEGSINFSVPINPLDLKQLAKGQSIYQKPPSQSHTIPLRCCWVAVGIGEVDVVFTRKWN